MHTDEMTYVLYLAVNQVNGKKYVGITGKGLEARKYMHEWSARKNSQYHFHRAIRKYGADSFRWYVIGWASTKEEIKTSEIDHVKFYKSVGEELYNMTSGGDGMLNPTPEVRAKMVVVGRIQGRRQAENGQLAHIRELPQSVTVRRTLGRRMIESGHSQAQGLKNVESGHIQRLGLIYGRKAVENKTGIHAPDYDRTKGVRAGGRISGHIRWKHDGVIDSCAICKRTPDEKRIAENLAMKLSRRKKREAAGFKYNANRAQCGLSSSHLQWHVNRNIVKLDCKLCNPSAAQTSTQAVAA